MSNARRRSATVDHRPTRDLILADVGDVLTALLLHPAGRRCRWERAVAAAAAAVGPSASRCDGHGGARGGGAGGDEPPRQDASVGNHHRIAVELPRSVHAAAMALIPGPRPTRYPTDSRQALVQALTLVRVGGADSDVLVDNLARRADELDREVRAWIEPAPPRRPTSEPAQAGELWCANCLQAGVRSPRSDRHAAAVCRWCANFQAQQGWLPPASLCDARSRGRRITESMVAAAAKDRRQQVRR